MIGRDMLLHLLTVVAFYGTPGIITGTTATDPLANPPLTVNCFDAWNITKCSENFAEAFSKVENADSDGISCNIKILLFTRRNSNKPEFLHDCDGRLPKNTNYKISSRTVIIVHGFLGNICGHPTITEMKDQLLFRDDYNVIVVDWSSCGLDTYVAQRQVRLVGKQIAFLVDNIMEQTNTTGEMFHIIGHSYGAQIAGFAGKHIKRDKIRRITGLDPGLGGFNTKDVNSKLYRTDAKFVDIIHTDSGRCVPSFSDIRPSGHADFFPNGGSVQLSCFPHIFEKFLKGDIFLAIACLFVHICYHLQSLEYFKASINACNCQFIGVKSKSYAAFKSEERRSCGSDGLKCAVMGMDSEDYPRPKRGHHRYFLDTSLMCPYCNNTRIDIQGFAEFLKKEDKPHCWPENLQPARQSIPRI